MHLEQAIASLRFDPLVPVWLIALLALLCVLVLAPAVWRRARGTIWRGLAFAVLLLWLAGPRLVQETRETLPDVGSSWWTRPPRCRSATARGLPRQRTARSSSRRRSLPDLGATHHHRARKRQRRDAGCSRRSTARSPTFLAHGSPGSSPSPTARCTTSPRPRRAACRSTCSSRRKGRRSTAACASSRLPRTELSGIP